MRMPPMHGAGALCALSALLSCVSDPPGHIERGERTLASDPHYHTIGGLTRAEDLDPEPDVVEVELVAETKQMTLRDGVNTKTPVWTYNGGIPGPLITAEVGDRLVVHFENRLPEPTTIHWHGLELPATMDGSHIAQLPVQPGETFTYEFDLLAPGTFWYHPHIRSNEQVERGLYGPLVVRDAEAEADLDLPRETYVLMLDDVLLDADDEIAAPFPDDPVANALTQLNGREGNVLLVNGEERPLAKVRGDEPIRLMLINASNARFMRVSLPGHSMVRIGADGGLIAEPIVAGPIELVDASGHGGHHTDTGDEPGEHEEAELMSDPDPSRGVLLSPGERADVVVTPSGAPKEQLALEWHDFPRGRHAVTTGDDGALHMAHLPDDGRRLPRELMTFEIKPGRTGDGPWPVPTSLRDIPPIDTTGAEPLRITLGHGMPDENGDITFFATRTDEGGVPWEQVDEETALHATVGETRIWEVTNLTAGDHNFHPHGFSFQVLSIEYIDDEHSERERVVEPAVAEIKDTMRIPARPGARMSSRTIARLAVRFDDAGREGQVAAGGKVPTATSSGGWFVHCHLLEHAARGMGTYLSLSYDAEPGN